MPEKDPSNYSMLTYAWVALLSMWGGAVSFIRKRNAGEARPFNFAEMVGDLMASGLAGVITFWLCEWAGTPPLLAAAMIGISGHMGGRALYRLEAWATKRFLGEAND